MSGYLATSVYFDNTRWSTQDDKVNPIAIIVDGAEIEL